MFKTMTCLVVAMTCTSALLGWIDPVSTTPTRSASLEDLPTMARAAVHEATAIRNHQWRAVEVLPGPAVTTGSALLAARSEPTTYHFYVDQYGRPSCTTAWVSQRATLKSPTNVAIQVARRGERQQMSHAQWQCVRALITAVSDVVGMHDTLLPVRLHPYWVDVYSPLPGTTLHVEPLQTSAG